MDFQFAPEMERVFIKDDPAMSYVFLGAWMMLPYLEPYLIRSMRQAMPRITDPQLKDDVNRFCAQEGEHYKQHAKANDIIRSLNPGFDGLKALEAELEAEYQRFSGEKPLRFNLAYAEGFEAMTSAMSRTQLEVGLFDRTESPLAHLARWHIMEELEHRTVAFDVYQHVCGSYLYRVFAGFWAQRHFTRWGMRFARLMMNADPEILHRYSALEIRVARKAFNDDYLKRARPHVLKTYTPWYNPRRIQLPANYESVREHYSSVATSLR